MQDHKAPILMWTFRRLNRCYSSYKDRSFSNTRTTSGCPHAWIPTEMRQLEWSLERSKYEQESKCLRYTSRTPVCKYPISNIRMPIISRYPTVRHQLSSYWSIWTSSSQSDFHEFFFYSGVHRRLVDYLRMES